MSTLLKNQYESPFPTLNLHRRDEPVATDTIYLDTPAVDSGATIAQVLVGVESLVTNVYAIKTFLDYDSKTSWYQNLHRNAVD